MADQKLPEPVDVLVIGGGVNGCGIARDAAGRGLSVMLVEQGDLAQATSSASTKLFHGGLRYLEYFEFRLVREALREREVLLRNMPHISWPMRFVLPLDPDMRFDSETPAGRLLALFLPWQKGRRPGWMIRLGLFLYDHMGGRKVLPPTTTLDLRKRPEGAPLKSFYQTAFEYSDCWVQDSRLVVLNARDARTRGARIATRTRLLRADRDTDGWLCTLEDTRTGERHEVAARCLVNAAGPWVTQVIGTAMGQNDGTRIRLVRGSHIVTKKLYEHEKSYFFQGPDGRIIFAIPYEQDFTLIGTTDVEHPDPDTPPLCTEAEQDYLCTFASRYFQRPVTRGDVVWTYSGVRPLMDDGQPSASAATRDYTLRLDAEGAPVLHVFGGKITTYRKLAEAAVDKLRAVLPVNRAVWTADAPLPGGYFPLEETDKLVARLLADYPFLSRDQAVRLFRTHGVDTWHVLGDARNASDLGQDFGAGLTAAEVDWFVENEFAQTAEDILWRRTRLGLRVRPDQVAALAAYLEGFS
ncbi:glycerol-3-phosphate dehydrogenase [Lutimaribacter saemankumensis]|uniref:Glycerol-3-phosphate dehydrogenase n=1 Tax=Lutimaribacter saemankumensis TaxID=490829 RepID=A0A1G8NAB1_9RHOB|nr:glycerol-3-phosphate dehydrogenase [Lutimaribacter saemankumensis]SDI77026.1 glycerol-3-phosphate dehydrogenase [Lutimaribacter saemankumensis]